MTKNLGNDYPEANQRIDRGVLGFFSIAERILLVIYYTVPRDYDDIY